MKQKIFGALLCSIALFLAGCAASEEKSYVPYEELPEGYGLEDAKNDGSVVFEDLSVTSGQETWDAFVTQTEKGERAQVRLVYYYTLGDPGGYDPDYYESIKEEYPMTFVMDLSFDGSNYTVRYESEGTPYSAEFPYMVKYEGTPNSSTALFSRYVYYVLVEDPSVTWDEIEFGILSSSSMTPHIPHERVYINLIE